MVRNTPPRITARSTFGVLWICALCLLVVVILTA